MHFPTLLSNPKARKCCLVVVFPFVILVFLGGWVACFVYLHIYLFYMDKSNVFCHTNICSLSCPGPGDSSRVVTMQAHTDLECFAALCLCILPWCTSTGTWQFSRCYKALETCY